MDVAKLTFRIIDTPTLVALYFSDGNVISADKEGLIAYSTVKTIMFKSKETQINSTFISAKDEDVTVWIKPCHKQKDMGLLNDIRLNEAEKTIRVYNIPEKHYNTIKHFLWNSNLEKVWPDD